MQTAGNAEQRQPKRVIARESLMYVLQVAWQLTVAALCLCAPHPRAVIVAAQAACIAVRNKHQSNTMRRGIRIFLWCGQGMGTAFGTSGGPETTALSCESSTTAAPSQRLPREFTRRRDMNGMRLEVV